MKSSVRLIASVIALSLSSSLAFAQVDGGGFGNRSDGNMGNRPESTIGNRPDGGKDMQSGKKPGKKPKNEMTEQEISDAIVSHLYTTPVYMFCVSAEFGDSTVYVTSVQEIDSVQLTKKYDFLRYRSYYSRQFTDFLSTAYATKNQTTSVFFDKKRSRLLKRFNKILKKYENTKGVHVVFVTEGKFQLKSSEDLSNVII